MSAYLEVLEGHGEAELFELGDETACSPFRVLSFGEVVAHVLAHLAGAEQMPDQLDQRVRDGDGRFVRSAASSDLPVLRTEVAVLGACRGPPGLQQRAAQPLVTAGGADRTALAGRLSSCPGTGRTRRRDRRGSGSGSCRHRLPVDGLQISTIRWMSSRDGMSSISRVASDEKEPR